MSKKILVTGGCGFIGSNFIRLLLSKYKDIFVVNLDLLTYAADKNRLKDISKDIRYKFIQGDISSQDIVMDILKNYKIEFVINFAAETHVDNSISMSDPFIYTNILGTYNLITVCKKYWLENDEKSTLKRTFRFLQVSTDEVYGSLSKNDSCFTEENNILPNSPYAASKASGDMILRSFFKTYGFPGIISRCSNNYGPNQNNEKLVPKIIENAFKGLKLPIYGDGGQIRDWIHVDDHCNALILILERGVIGSVYNIGANCEMTNLNLVTQILEILDKPKNLIEFVDDRLGHDYRYSINSNKLRTELGWEPNISFESGLLELINQMVFKLKDDSIKFSGE